jgi:hypothetical protein
MHMNAMYLPYCFLDLTVAISVYFSTYHHPLINQHVARPLLRRCLLHYQRLVQPLKAWRLSPRIEHLPG